MKSVFSFLMVTFMAVFMFSLNVMAQAAPAVPAQNGQWLMDIVSKFPKMSAVLFAIGALRLTLKPAFAFAHNLFQSWGLVAWDQKESAIEVSKPMTTLFFILDWFASIKAPVAVDNSAQGSQPAQPSSPPAA